MSSQHRGRELLQHKEQVTDKLQGLITTVTKLPDLIHGESSKQVSQAVKDLAALERSIQNPTEVVAALPKELSVLDQGLDQALARAADLQQGLAILQRFNSSNSGSSSSSGSAVAASGSTSMASNPSAVSTSSANSS